MIDGDHFSDLDGFYDEIYSVMTCRSDRDRNVGYNLDSLNDVLRGGFGMHGYGEPVQITWKNFAKSRDDLGTEMTEKILEIMLNGNEDHDCLVRIEN